MRYLIISLLCLLTISAAAQTATVYEVPKHDAAQLKAAYDRFKAAEQEYNALRDAAVKNATDSLGVVGMLSGVGSCGYEFSKDFRFVVPAVCSQTITPRWGNCSNWCTGLTQLGAPVGTGWGVANGSTALVESH